MGTVAVEIEPPLPDKWWEQLNRAVARGIAHGGAPCCGTTGVNHLPLCPAGRDGVNRMTVRQWPGLE